MASHYTRSRARRPDTPVVEGSDVEPADAAPIIATSSSTADTFVGMCCGRRRARVHVDRAGWAPPGLLPLPRADPVC